jgi:hypothetical protein
MDSRESKLQVPAAPESASADASVHAADGLSDLDLGTPSAAGGTDVIKATDLVKLFAVVEAAVGLFNALEQDQHIPMAPEVYNAWGELGTALDELGVEQV